LNIFLTNQAPYTFFELSSLNMTLIKDVMASTYTPAYTLRVIEGLEAIAAQSNNVLPLVAPNLNSVAESVTSSALAEGASSLVSTPNVSSLHLSPIATTSEALVHASGIPSTILGLGLSIQTTLPGIPYEQLGSPLPGLAIGQLPDLPSHLASSTVTSPVSSIVNSPIAQEALNTIQGLTVQLNSLTPSLSNVSTPLSATFAAAQEILLQHARAIPLTDLANLVDLSSQPSTPIVPTTIVPEAATTLSPFVEELARSLSPTLSEGSSSSSVGSDDIKIFVKYIVKQMLKIIKWGLLYLFSSSTFQYGYLAMTFEMLPKCINAEPFLLIIIVLM
jgi:hypothetical protein